MLVELGKLLIWGPIHTMGFTFINPACNLLKRDGVLTYTRCSTESDTTLVALRALPQSIAMKVDKSSAWRWQLWSLFGVSRVFSHLIRCDCNTS